MNTKKLMFGAAIAATIALVFPSQALATAATTQVNQTGTNTAATSMQGGDLLDVSAKTPTTFDTASSAGVTREVTRSSIGLGWNSSSLQLASFNSVVHPEGWNLEYTTDGTTWSSTEPANKASVIGVRTSGSSTKTC